MKELGGRGDVLRESAGKTKKEVVACSPFYILGWYAGHGLPEDFYLVAGMALMSPLWLSSREGLIEERQG